MIGFASIVVFPTVQVACRKPAVYAYIISCNCLHKLNSHFTVHVYYIIQSHTNQIS